MNRIYIFTGKGGVGKTSIAAAHAIKSAQEGVKTLLVSTDMAHNLEDIFDTKIGKNPVQVMEHLDLYEIDPTYVMEQDFQHLKSSFSNFLPLNDREDIQEYGMFPGMEELFSLLKIAELYQNGTYKRMIVDCAPTGETLSLLKFPELLAWYMEKLFPVGKVAMRILSPISERLFKVQLPNKVAMTDIEKLYVKLSELQELLKNRETTSIRLVTIPEKMVVEETKRNYMYMNLYNFNVDGLYMNRILPEDIENPFFEEWLQIQKKYIEQLEESFGALPIYKIPWYDEELRGITAVKRMVDDVLGFHDVFEVKEMTQREVFEKKEDSYLLTVAIPYARKEDLELHQSETDVIIKIHNFKRNIPLPNILRDYVITSGKLEDGKLKLEFKKGEDEDEYE